MPPKAEDEGALLEALRQGDENAFSSLVDRYHPSLLRLARIYVSSDSIAQEVVQETWLRVLRGIRTFEGRSSLRTWIFRILINRAKTHAEREGRSVSFSSLGGSSADAPGHSVEPERFLPGDHPDCPGQWASPPKSWGQSPEERLLAQEILARIREVVESLPAAQREVILLKDVEQFTSDEVCSILSITSANYRVLLHRARSRVRRALEGYLSGGLEGEEDANAKRS
jgi:RNA polymerase sigma-70 factor, ECF subfamily